jgi:hypothetical protein
MGGEQQASNNRKPTAVSELCAAIKRRARSVEMDPIEYIQAIYDEDCTLEVDRGIMATIIVWSPIVALLAALALVPQGQDLLAQFASDARARGILLLMTAALCIIASVFSTNLIACWFFPRIARAAQGAYLFWPNIPKSVTALDAVERREVFRWTALPTVVTIALPLAFLAEAVFGFSGWVSTLIFIISLVLYSALVAGTVYVATRLVRQTISASRLALLVAVLGLFGFAYAPVWFTFTFTTPVVAVVAVICWLLVIHAFTFLVFLSRYEVVAARRHWQRLARIGVPKAFLRHATLILMALAAYGAMRYWPRPPVWMWRGDGRLVALGPIDTSTKPAPALPLAKTFSEFADALPASESKRKSLVLVTAAGGGIRAAYWTAAVLTALQDGDTTHNFGRNIFAISAVSGGALGAATYKALTPLDKPNCMKATSYRGCADEFLSGDFVGPNVLAAITGEPLQVISGGLAPFPARDVALQNAWSYQWFLVAGNNAPSFSDDFDALFKKSPTPALLLNGTSLMTGRRTITSNLDVSSLRPNDTEMRANCPQESGILNPAQYLKLSASAAVLTSARFPYVTPAGLLSLDGTEQYLDGTVHRVNCWAEIVDGGYVDNEGIVTMRDVLHKLIDSIPHKEGESPEKAFADAYRIIVLRLSSQPSPTTTSSSAQDTPDRDAPGQLYAGLNNQRNASGRELVSDFKREVQGLGGCLIELNALYDDAPLGWSLSLKSRNRLNAWLDGPHSMSWTMLYGKDKGDPGLEALAKDVRMPERLKLVQNLVNGQNVGCDLPKAAN